MTNSINATAQSTAQSGARAGNEAGPAKERSSGTDAVELSEAAQERIEHEQAVPLRAELIERVRAEIAAGTYLTDDKLDAAVSQLREALFTAA